MKTRLGISLITVLSVLLLMLIQAFAGIKENIKKMRQEREERILEKPSVRDQEQAALAVVKIVAKDEQGGGETGSGIFLGSTYGKLYILTAYHVVKWKTDISVEFYGLPGRLFQAQFLISDEALDLAVISVSYSPIEVRERIAPFRTGRASDIGDIRSGRAGMLIADTKGSVLGMSDTNVTVVDGIAPDSPAERSGLQTGDVIIELNGQKVQSANHFIEIFKQIPTGGDAVLRVLRRGRPLEVTLRVKQRSGPDARSVYSIGHPKGAQWAWRAGWILAHEGDLIRLSGEVVSEGISGGPLFDDRYRVIGVIMKAGPTSGTALKIEKALEKVFAWRVPYRIWLAEGFCDKLITVLNERKSDFKGIRKGAPKMDLSDKHIERYWDTSIDLSGQGKSRIVLYKSREFRYESTLFQGSSDEEAGIVHKDVVESVKQCIPKPFLEEDKFGIYLEFKRGGFWGNVEKISIMWFATAVILRIP